MFLDKKAILAAQDRITADVEVPEWGGKVRIKEPSLLELETFLALNGTGETGKAMIELVAISMIDANGDRMFVTEEEKALLAGKSFIGLKRVFEAANSIREEQPKQEDLVKNSQEMELAASSSP